MALFTYLVDTKNEREEYKLDVIQYDTETGELIGTNPDRLIRREKGLIASNYLAKVLGYEVLEAEQHGN